MKDRRDEVTSGKFTGVDGRIIERFGDEAAEIAIFTRCEFSGKKRGGLFSRPDYSGDRVVQLFGLVLLGSGGLDPVLGRAAAASLGICRRGSWGRPRRLGAATTAVFAGRPGFLPGLRRVYDRSFPAGLSPGFAT